MRKLAKFLAFLAFAFGVCVSFAKTADQKASARSRLTQSIGIKGKVPGRGIGSQTLKPTLPDTSNRVVRTPASVESEVESDGPSAFGEKPAASKKNSEIKIPAGIDMFKLPAAMWGKNGHDESAQGRSSEIGDPNAGNGDGGNGGGNRIVSDDNAPAANPSDFGRDEINKQQNNAGNGTPQGVTPRQVSGGDASVKGTSKQLGKWWPVCAFIDQGIDEKTANDAMKGMVDKAAKCNVKIEVFPVRVSDWGTTNEFDADTINNLSIKQCNVPGGIAASATALVPPAWKYTAAVMCGDFRPENGGPHKRGQEEGEWNAGVAGCAQLRSGSKIDDEYIKANDKPTSGDDHKHSVSAASGAVAPSIEVASGHNANVVSHEALGHSQMGKPNGSRYGLGIGEEEDTIPGKDNKVTGDAMTDSWTGAGCGVMYSQAHDNSEWTRVFGGTPPTYDSSRDTYYKPGDYLYSMSSSPRLFEKRNGVPLPGPMLARVPPPQSGGTISRVQLPPKTGDDPVAAMKVGEPAPEEAEPTKHKKGQSAAVDLAANASLRKKPELKPGSQPIPEPRANVEVATVTPESGPLAGPRKSIEYAEDAPQLDPAAFGKPGAKGNIDAETYNPAAVKTSVANASSFKPGNRATMDDNATDYAPGAGAMDAGPSTAPSSSAGSGMDQLAMGGSAFSMGGAGGTSGSSGGKSSLSGKEFFDSVDGEQEEAEEISERRKKAGRRAPRAKRDGTLEGTLDGAYRRPANVSPYGEPVL